MTGGELPRVANVNTRRAILEELRISRRVICTGDELTPRLYVYSPSGIYLVLIPLPENEDKRRDLLWHARLFMVWKAVTGFILSTEIKDSRRHHGYAGDARRSNGAWQQLISRDPVKFAEPVWFGREDVEQAIIDLLPAKFVQLTADEMLIIGEFENGTVPELTWFKARDDE